MKMKPKEQKTNNKKSNNQQNGTYIRYFLFPPKLHVCWQHTDT